MASVQAHVNSILLVKQEADILREYLAGREYLSAYLKEKDKSRKCLFHLKLLSNKDIPQFTAQNFSHVGFRDFINKFNLFGDFVAGEFYFAMCAYVLYG